MDNEITKSEAIPMPPAETSASAESAIPAEAAAPTEQPTPTEPAPSNTPSLDEAPVLEAAQTPEGADSASEGAPAAEPTQEAASTASEDTTGQPCPTPGGDSRYNNKYAKQHRADLDRMAEGPEKNYLLDRVFPQMSYYSRHSASYKKAYHLMMIFCIILNGVIPFVMLFEECAIVAPYVKYMVTALSSAAGILTAIVALKQHRELWIQYRICLEQLKRAVSMYFLGVGDYDQGQSPEERARTLFAVCENILSAEHNQWTELNKVKKDD